MKEWSAADINCIEIRNTEYHLLGNTRDGGYVGDGILSGHSKWECPHRRPQPTPAPMPITEPIEGSTTVDDIS